MSGQQGGWTSELCDPKEVFPLRLYESSFPRPELPCQHAGIIPHMAPGVLFYMKGIPGFVQ